MKEFIVPVDDVIIEFKKHLKAYPRTILSSKFGDGKSYFIEKLKKDPKLSKRYEFLTIYPVNYQVVGNKDIFEILKRDILFQLMMHGMISNDVRLTEAEALSWFVYKKGGSLMMDLLPYLAEVGLEKEDSVKVIAVVKGLKLLKDLKDNYEKFKIKELKSDDDLIDAFLEKADNEFIYECDVITRIIQKAIADYQHRTKKKVVLFVEDMDRIDPAHLFRILNVLSAHMDYCYKYSMKPDASLIGNKFGIDNIVLVIDYHNLKSIYIHFYGSHADFSGYISKFLSGVPFYYSLERMRHSYVVNKLAEITNLNADLVDSLFTSDFLTSKTMRELVQSFSVQKTKVDIPVVNCGGQRIKLNTSFLYLMSVMRRLRWADDEIKAFVLNIKNSNQEVFVRYVLPFAFISDCKNVNSNSRTVLLENRDVSDRHEIYRTEIILDTESGIATIESRWTEYGDEKETAFDDIIETMFKFIS